MKKALQLLFTVLKWTVVAVVAVEVFCFLVIIVSNKFLYGTVWEGSRVNYDAYALFLNEEGPRPTVHNAPPEGKLNRTLWLFGGSTMRGEPPHDDRSIPSFLAALLNRESRPLSFKVLNFGENSFNSLMQARYLQKLLIESATPPDLVIFYDGANDCTYFAQFRHPYGHHGYQRVKALVESHRRSLFGLLKPLNAAWAASYTLELYSKLRLVVVPLEADSELVRSFVDLTERRYEHVRRLADCYGAQFFLFWQPTLWVESGAVSPQVREKEKEYVIQKERFAALRHNFTVPYLAVADRLKDKPYFANFQNILCSRTEPVYTHDGVHLNDTGRSMVARRMAELLKERWLKTGAGGPGPVLPSSPKPPPPAP